MKRNLVALFLGAFLFLAQTTWAEELHQHNTLIERARDATVLIATEGESSGFGSGFLISDDGLVVTNYHVIHRADKILVWFYDEDDPKHYPAEVVGIDPVADIAVLRMTVKPDMLPLEYLTIEDDAAEIRIGDEVVAIGHLLGLDWTITRGHISHVNRINRISPYVRIIQHTATINRGNSGGPTINLEGNVVGVNAYTRLDKDNKTVGVSFAVRGDYVYIITTALIADGEIVRPAMLVKFTQLSKWGRERLEKEHPDVEFPNTFGVIAVSIAEDSWAYQQGLRTFDAVVGINGIPVNGLLNLTDAIVGLEVGTVINLFIIRDGVFMVLPYELGELEFDYFEYYDKKVSQEESDQGGPR